MKGSTLLLALIVMFTFPIWIGLLAGGFGLVVGILGAIFGVVFGIIGAIFGAIGGIFEAIFSGIFGWGHHRFEGENALLDIGGPGRSEFALHTFGDGA